MTSAHLVGHPHPYPGRGRVMKRAGPDSRAPRLVAPHELSLFSDRLDDALEYESTIRDFAVLHERVLCAKDYNS